MALFVLGAGATRGSSFVDPEVDPCLPPLDRDFFTQLQRVRNPKHQKLIKEVMKDVVQVFGQNFDVTMEIVFSTYEHTVRMLSTTGENRDFRRTELREKRDRLEQAIAVVLEDSLSEKDEDGHSRVVPRSCEHHDKLVMELIEPQDEIITFNYDCVIDDSLRRHGSNKWNARYGYGFDLGAGGSLLSGDKYWQPVKPASKDTTVKLFKLHGSLHFDIKSQSQSPRIKLKERPYTRQRGSMRFSIIPPEWHKAYDKGAFARLWKNAAAAINRARDIVVVGYSLPATDLHSTALFRTSVKAGGVRSLVVVNPDQESRKRCRTIFQRGLNRETRVISYEYLSHFVATNRKVWSA